MTLGNNFQQINTLLASVSEEMDFDTLKLTWERRLAQNYLKIYPGKVFAFLTESFTFI